MTTVSAETISAPAIVPDFGDDAPAGRKLAIICSKGDLWACRMSADMMHLDEADLYEQVEAIINASDFIEKTDGAQLLFI
jgi:predicted peroxiredoxin